MVLTQGFLTLGTSGIQTYNLGISTTPTWIEVIVCEKATTDNDSHRSHGFGTATKQHCLSTDRWSAGQDSFNSSSYIVRHYEGGSLVLSAKLNQLISTGVKFDIDTPNVDYPVFVRVGN